MRLAEEVSAGFLKPAYIVKVVNDPHLIRFVVVNLPLTGLELHDCYLP